MKEMFLKSLPIKVYPKENNIRNLGFYLVIHKSTRYEKVSDKSLQITLFKDDNPYLHFVESIDTIIDNIEYINGEFVSGICDNSVYDLAEISEEGKIDQDKNIRREKINELISRYDFDLTSIEDEHTAFLIQELLVQYVEGNFEIDVVEEVIKKIQKMLKFN